jgi:hypothetical protein
MDGETLLAPPPPPTGATQAELDALWAKLLADSEQAQLRYMQQYTPPLLQPHLAYYIAQQPPPVSGGQTVPVVGADGAAIGTGVIDVANGVITNVQLAVSGLLVKNGDMLTVRAATKTAQGQAAYSAGAISAVTLVAQAAIINSGDNVIVWDAAGAAQPGSPGAATVAAGLITNVRLTV